MKLKLSTVLIAGLAGGLLSAHAAVIYTSADTTSLVSTSSVGWAYGSIDHVSDGSGLSEQVLSLSDANIASTTHGYGFDQTRQILKPGAPDGIFEFTFSAAQDLTDIYVWNYSQGGNNDLRGIGAYEIYLDTGAGFVDPAVVSGSLAAASSFLDGNGGHFAQRIDLGATFSGVVGVRIDADSLGSADHLGLDEVVFRAVPEPATLGLVAAFGGGLLFVRRVFSI